MNEPMTGYHEVRAFDFTELDSGWRLTNAQQLPDGWKPFAAFPWAQGVRVVARKWHRAEHH